MKFKDIKGKEYDIPISSIDGVKKFDLNGEMIYPIETETAPCLGTPPQTK